MATYGSDVFSICVVSAWHYGKCSIKIVIMPNLQAAAVIIEKQLSVLTVSAA